MIRFKKNCGGSSKIRNLDPSVFVNKDPDQSLFDKMDLNPSVFELKDPDPSVFVHNGSVSICIRL